MRKVERFVDAVKQRIKPEEFSKLCLMAKTGKMGFGKDDGEWGGENTL